MSEKMAQIIEDKEFREHKIEQHSNALLDLPPPPHSRLLVKELSVGVPDKSKTTSWFSNRFKRKAKEEDKVPKKTFILEDVSCECQPGQVLAILGGSGSGKTTLLNAVAHRLGGLPIKNGEIGYYGEEQTKLRSSEVKRRIGFVRQQDYLLECLTVRETLTYAAQLRLPSNIPSQIVRTIVEQTIDELGLRDAADTVVGGPLRKGISGGEKRRLSIGCVLVTLPSVLILDEPTSGLDVDAFTSYLLLLTLSQLAKRGRTVILSIHAPRSDAFDLFDRICLLSKGKVVYSGLQAACLSWFSGLGHYVETGVNPLDFLIDISSVDNRDPDKEEASKARVAMLVSAWRDRDPSEWLHDLALKKEALRTSLTLPERYEQPDEPEVGGGERLGTTKRPGWIRQTRVIMARAHKNVYRNVPQLIGFAIQSILLGVIIGLTFFQLPDTPTGIQSLKNLSFQLIPGVFYLQQVFWIWKFCTDLVIFDREREDRLYDVVPFIASDFVSFLAPSVLSPAVYVILVYFIAGLRKDDLAARLFTTVASTVCVQFCVQGGSLIAVRSITMSRNLRLTFYRPPWSDPLPKLRSLAIPLTSSKCEDFDFNGNLPAYVAWIRWISPYFYSFRIVATEQYKDRVFNCPQDSAANLGQCVGNNVLAGLHFNTEVNIGAWFGGLLGLAIAEYAIACFILWIYPAGGVRHAAEIESSNRGKGTDVAESHMTRDAIDVEVRNLTFVWRRRGRGIIKEKRRTILDSVSAVFPAGEVSAILGPSGAGKSTLLQLLAHRPITASPLSHFTTSGQLLFANQPASSTSRSNVAFVEQDDDWHLPSLTVRETLRYAAILRLPNKMPRREKVARAETVLRMLGLKDCADLPVGGQLLKGISGGEKRRLSLAVQMINDPAVLLVDEPTSGLDASIALSVMQVLRDIAATGRTVIATIHQPRSDIWRLADNVMLLAKGGVVAYSGKRADAVSYFTSIGHPVPSEFFNPADHLLDLVSVDPRISNHEKSLARVNAITSRWRSTNRGESGEEHISGIIMTRGEGTTSMRVALPVVIVRHWINLWRRKDIFFNRLVQTPLLGGLFILFYQRLTHGPSGAQDRIGLTIESTTAIPFVGLLNAMAIFPADRNLYLHESKSSARYSPATFLITYTIAEIGFELLGAFGYAAIMNIAVGMQTSARIYFEYSATIWAMLNMGESFAIIFGTWIHTEGLTVTIVSTILSLAGQISGVISLSVPNWLSAIAWGTCVKVATHVQVINETIGLKFYCTAAEIQNGECVAQTGEQMLALFGWRDLDTARYVGITIAICLAWRFVAWLSLVVRVGGIR
ncbi:P-loop containing nucleoside triphosphate hydrolase protein [Naematelia encephala]|uniref:p-loop containing nucleoside triphosphate hydrolase protein n=1 Tax=Naematelia encephala TaxID=71784 RepID=A0A1Y2AYK9_9TREE|nr:P-loop containing nucleoside triphosphate hydrolase protein [Naematelia encephala]